MNCDWRKCVILKLTWFFISNCWNIFKGNVECSIEQILPAKKLAKDFNIVSGNEVFSTHMVDSELHCADVCLRHQLCLAYIIQYSAPRNKTCLLFRKTNPDKTGYSKKGFGFRIFERKDFVQVKQYFKSSYISRVFYTTKKDVLNCQIGCPASFAGTFNFALMKIAGFRNLFIAHPKSSSIGNQFGPQNSFLILNWTKT